MDKHQSVDLEEKRPTRSSDLQNKRLTGSIATIALTAASLGVIYGDLGTSPLYVFNAIFPSDGPTPNKEDVIGALSAIIWALTIVPLVKYAVIALEFGGKDNETGEGGPFAVYTALYPPAEETDDNRVLTSYTTMTRPRVDSFFEKTWVKQALFSWVLFGTCLTFSDGLLTPAVSVVSAVEGIAVASPPVANSVVPISIAILVCLFLLQALGTRRVGFLFAPIIGVWLITIAVSGAINVASHPSVFRAFDPSRAVLLFVRTGNYDLLSGVLLCITGCEAMFANLGQFSKTSIRLGFVGLVYPCCVLAYLGQGARLIEDGDNVIGNVFFQSIPGGVGGGFWYFTFVFAILAAIIASQAMISATFSLIHQLTRLKVMPAVRIVHSSDDVEGQVFVPAINILLMIGTVALTAGFGAGAGLTNAYGFAVAGVLIVTTTILTIAIVKLKRLPVIVAVIFFVFFIFVDGAFWGASLKKVPEGAWVPLGLAIILCIFLQFYAWAQGLEDKFDATHRTRLHNVIARGFISESDDEDSTPITGLSENGNESEKIMESNDLSPAIATGSVGLQLPTLRKRPASAKLANYNDDLTLVKNNATLNRLPVFALFHNHSANTMNGAPHSFSAFLKCYPSLPQVCIFFNLRVVGIPHTNDEQRFIVSRVRSFDGIYIATIRLGYRDPINLADIARPIRDRIVAIESCGGEDAEEIRERIRMIDNAMELSVTHILPHFHVTVDQTQGTKFTRYIKTFLIESIYRRLKLNFDDYDAFEFGSSEESVLRMGVSAKL